MLTSLQLKNYRCFGNHSVRFNKATVVVGRNNAGKSTLVEALSLVSILVSRLPHLPFEVPPAWTELPDYPLCVAASLRDLDINFETIFHHYAEPPATITARFCGNKTLRLYLGREKSLYATIQVGPENWILSRAQAQKVQIAPVHILPQVGPLLKEERKLSRDHVLGSMHTHLAPAHFRNQLLVLNRDMEDFRQLAESTWPSLRVQDLVETHTEKGTLLSLFIRDQDFEAEVGCMGHGLQMWLQTMWFLSRVPRGSTVILDEPDVYMHPDLQRRLFRVVRDHFQQTVITTHSVEIMAEAEPGDILIIDRRRRRSRFVDSEPTLQHVIDQIGGAHNVQLARLWNSQRFLLVEGKDLTLLRQFHNLLFPDSEHSLDSTPHMAIGGWGGWNYAVGSHMAIRNNVGDKIFTYCILDRDYHTANEIAERSADASKRGVHLHIWGRKEIENYLLDPHAIRRTIAKRAKDKEKVPLPDEVNDIISRVADGLKDGLVHDLAEQYSFRDRALGLKACLARAGAEVEGRWGNPEERLSMIPGKVALSRLSAWATEEYGVSFGPVAVAHSFTRAEVPGEVIEVLRAIEDCRGFN